jgi:hypothetical protein
MHLAIILLSLTPSSHESPLPEYQKFGHISGACTTAIVTPSRLKILFKLSHFGKYERNVKKLSSLNEKDKHIEKSWEEENRWNKNGRHDQHARL